MKEVVMGLRYENAAFYKGDIKKLYSAAFPKEERPPLFYLYYKARKGKADFHAVIDGENFVGLTFITGTEDVITLMFFAIEDSARGKGYGSQVLNDIQRRYDGKKLFLNIEVVDRSAENYEQRLKRKEFYRKNRFESEEYKVREGGVTYEMLSFGGHVTKDEYSKVMEKLFGKLLYFFIKRW